MAKLNYVELPARDIASMKAFYASAFQWSFTDFGPDYAATMGEHSDLGFNGAEDDRTAAPLAVIEVPDLEAALASVTAAGGAITVPIFGFPGGRRFHFRDPSGNELAAMQPASG
jgi:uncharacterized protein